MGSSITFSRAFSLGLSSRNWTSCGASTSSRAFFAAADGRPADHRTRAERIVGGAAGCLTSPRLGKGTDALQDCTVHRRCTDSCCKGLLKCQVHASEIVLMKCSVPGPGAVGTAAGASAPGGCSPEASSSGGRVMYTPGVTICRQCQVCQTLASCAASLAKQHARLLLYWCCVHAGDRSAPAQRGRPAM
jgi:hypothetical protein